MTEYSVTLVAFALWSFREKKRK